MSPRSRKPPVKRLKGLDNLFGEEPFPLPCLAIEQIILPSQQPRRYFDPEKLEQLVQSVREHGILEPLLVRPLSEGNYELVAGERRYRAAQAVGLSEVPVVVKALNEREALQLALIENLQREDLSAFEETEGIVQLLALQLECPVEDVPKVLYRLQNERLSSKSNGNVTINAEAEAVEQVFAGLGLMTWQSFIRNRLPLLNLPEDILEALRQGQIAYTKATVLARIEDEQERQSLLQDAITSSLSLSQIRERVKASQPPLEQGEFAARIDATTKRVKKLKVWENPSKRSRLESLLKQLEALISESGLDEAQPIEEAEANQNQPPPSAKSEPESSLIELGLDSLESQQAVTEEFFRESSSPSPRTAEVPDEGETPSSSSNDEPQPDFKEEQAQKGNESTGELVNSSLTHSQMVQRLMVKSSTLGSAKKRPDLAEWIKSRDPDEIAWQWVAESKRFLPLKN
ncbi:MAG: ParB/RepB/Spo0J family partition protein [Symplocastrum torsivum CPER-KK1]|jgi:ParB family chromosome partitioning protein|uniref:ParB/RepB/Spo0J family partition protein n=1 Tax=Symplocastrum torsivum CPER-KK1 TaxID=450513 RepID=A0A951PSU3_9CYAN|nr:ParB/RepB/Spo0J family partition protein [Symplocastrum torsivum CPER-KK1]